MQRYGDIDRDSGVVAYESGPDFIRLQFKDGSLYLYTSASAGPDKIALMKVFAQRGQGLNAFINTQVRRGYARREQ